MGGIFLTTHFKHFDFIERCDLNSSSNSLFEILPVKDFLDDFLMHLCILYNSLKMLKSFSSGLILINTQLSSLSNAFVSLFHSQNFCHYDPIHQLQLQVYIHENKGQSCSL